MKKLLYAVDSETYYGDDCSVESLGPEAYCKHPDWSCYLIQVVGEDGYRYVGPPEEMDWSVIAGHTWLLANAAFDLAVIARLQELGVAPKTCVPSEVFDVLDMSRYLQQPGNLAGAAKALLGKERSKAVRASMKNKLPKDLSEEKLKALYEYGLHDAEDTLELWQKCNHLWPEWERRISKNTREMAHKGLPVDIDLLRTHETNLKTSLFAIRELIPWEDPVMSPKNIAIYCREHGILPPLSMAKDSPIFDQWLEKHGEAHPAVKAVSDYRRVNTLTERISVMVRRTREDGTLPYGVKYCGATATRRFSGSSGLNFHNMAREAMFGVDVRKTIVAPEGFLWAVVDTTSIEPAVGSVLCKDMAAQEFLRAGGDVYEQCARVLGFYSDPRPIKKVDKALRQRMKPIRLGGEYGQGPGGLIEYAKGYGVTFSTPEAEHLVGLFRERYVYIRNQWRKLDMALRNAAGRGDLVINLPSGNTLTYRDVHYKTEHGKTDIVATMVKGSRPIESRLWGSRIHENCLAAGTLVVTRRGLVPIEEISASVDAIWDGEDWVCCSAVVNKGEQYVMSVDGVLATPDHKFLVNGSWVFASEIGAHPDGEHMNFKTTVYDLLNCGPRHRFAVVSPFTGKTLIAHNCCQAVARDVLCQYILDLEDEGFDTRLTVHDEAVVLVPIASAEKDLARIITIMSTPPKWMPSLPAGAEGFLTKEYRKG